MDGIPPSSRCWSLVSGRMATDGLPPTLCIFDEHCLAVCRSAVLEIAHRVTTQMLRHFYHFMAVGRHHSRRKSHNKLKTTLSQSSPMSDMPVILIFFWLNCLMAHYADVLGMSAVLGICDFFRVKRPSICQDQKMPVPKCKV